MIHGNERREVFYHIVGAQAIQVEQAMTGKRHGEPAVGQLEQGVEEAGSDMEKVRLAAFQFGAFLQDLLVLPAPGDVASCRQDERTFEKFRLPHVHFDPEEGAVFLPGVPFEKLRFSFGCAVQMFPDFRIRIGGDAGADRSGQKTDRFFPAVAEHGGHGDVHIDDGALFRIEQKNGLTVDDAGRQIDGIVKGAEYFLKFGYIK